MKYTTLILLFVCNFTFGQQYMVVGKDTLPFKAIMSIEIDTIHKNSLTYITTDTSYTDPCNLFEKVNGKIINRTDSSCLQQGLWITYDRIGNYTISIYINGNDDGQLSYYNPKGKLLKKTESASLGNEYYIVKAIDYSSGHPIIIRYFPLFKFFIENFFIVLPILIVILLFRIILNNKIYNIENETNYLMHRTTFRLLPKLMEPGELTHKVLCAVTLCFIKYKPENKHNVIISNLLSLICFVGFFILIVGQIICSRPI